MNTYHLIGTTILCMIFSAFGSLKALEAGKVVGEIKLDGKLDEPSWEKAQPSEPFQWLEVSRKETSPAQTTFRLLRGEDAIYLGIRCEEPLMDKLSAQPLPHDGSVWERDCVEIFLDPEGKGVRYYHLMVSAGNSRYDTYRIEGGHTEGGEYNPEWESAVHKGKDFWSVEVRIPQSAFFYTDSAAFSDTWGLNVTRERKPVDELTCWAQTERSFHRPDKFKRVGGMPRKDASLDVRILKAKPIVAQPADGGFDGRMELEASATSTSAGNYELSVEIDGKALVTGRSVEIKEGTTVLGVDHLKFKELGRRTFKFTLRSHGKTSLAASYPLYVEYCPVTIDLTEPFYAQCIFPGQECPKIAGNISVHLPAKDMDGAQVEVSLAGPGAQAKPVTVKLKDGKAGFTLDADGLQEGEHPLTCRVLGKKKELAGATVIIRKLPPAPGSCVSIDRNLNLVMDGKTLFVRSWMGDEKYMMSAELLKKSPHPDSKFVNFWSGAITMEAERLDRSEAAERVKLDVDPSPKVFEEMKKNIEANRSDKGARYHYLCDEPECRMVSPVYLKHQYDYIKKHDPYHPVVIVTRAPELYTKCADILSPHPYPNPVIESSGKRKLSNPISQTRQMTRTILEAGHGKIAPWYTAQTFSYRCMDKQADYPTFDEYQSSVFCAVANGSKGVFPFLYFDHFNSVDLRLGSDFVYETLAGLEKFLISGAPNLPVTVAPSDGAVDAWLKTVEGATLLIVVNIEDRKLDVTIESAGLKGIQELYGYRSEAGARINNGKLQVSLDPYEARLFTNPRMGADLKTVENFRKELATARAALKKPGNILLEQRSNVEWQGTGVYSLGMEPSACFFYLNDGICDGLGFYPLKLPWSVEALFRSFVPKFKTAKIYAANIEDLELWAWKAGEWMKVGEVKGNQEPVMVIKSAEEITTVKIKIVAAKAAHPEKRAEFYEVELYNE